MQVRQAKRAFFARRQLTPTFAQLVNVLRRKDSVVVATAVTLAEAQELIAKAVRQKRAALVIG